MARISEQARERQMELVWLRVKQRPNGITEQEIADATGIQRRTVNNYLNELALEGKVEKQGRLWFLGDYEEIRSIKLEVTPEEAYTYYLGSRLFVKQHDKRNRLAEKALMQLADALAANKLVGQEIAQAARELAQRPADPKYEKVFQKIVCGYLQRRQVAIRYKPLKGEAFDTTFNTYLMEPSAIGYATYIIGHSHLQNQRRAYKLERIEDVEILPESYRIPDDFPGLEILRNSWSIIMGEKTIKVVLRFSPKVKERVLETQWHPSQQDDHNEHKTKDDYLLWWVQVADTLDMESWIRSWGADVEVLEPLALRQQLIQETFKLVDVYGLSSNKGDNRIMDVFEKYLTLPGKTEPKLTIFEHSSDVYHIALYLLEANQERITNQQLVKAGAIFHDVGKIEQNIQSNQWVHQPHSSKYLRSLMEHPRMKRLLSDNNIDLQQVSYEDLLLICEHHHDIPTRPDLLRRSPDALLVSVADVIASSLESGWIGNIRKMLFASSYIKLNTMLLKNLELDAGLDGEIHRVDLPADSVADALLCDLIYRDMGKTMGNDGLKPLLQKKGSLWVVGDENALRAYLTSYKANVMTLYETANIDLAVIESFLVSPNMPSPGILEPSSMKFLLLNEQIAIRMAAGLVARKSTKEATEYFQISFNDVKQVFQGFDFVDKDSNYGT